MVNFNLKKLLAVTVLMQSLFQSAVAGESNTITYYQVGNTTYGSDGSRYYKVGNTTYGSDGSWYYKVGNTTYGSDGSRYYKVGNTTLRIK